MSISIIKAKKSDTDDQRQDEDTRGNISSAVELTDNATTQNRFHVQPGYSSGLYWDKGDISGEMSAEDSKPFHSPFQNRTDKSKKVG